MNIGSDQVQSLVKARRLLLLASQVEKKRLDPKVETRPFKEVIESGDPRPGTGAATSIPGGTNIDPQPKFKYDQPVEGSSIDKLV